ncbi:MAG TPA: nucleotidyltransferase domain-containing protein [bacterium]|nr:nucleotidyltransferase domain-containing protein [bacterium]
MTNYPLVLDRLVDTIVRQAHPVRIILFGSAARGDMNRDSDLDLLIVMPNGTHRLRTAQNLYMAIGDIPGSIDLLVATLSDLENHGENPGLIYRTILNEGKVLYAT